MTDFKLNEKVWKEMDRKPGVYINQESAYEKFNSSLKNFDRIRQSMLSNLGSELTDEQRRLLESL